jgi:2-oxoglutarate dehydrogenase E2 component (dihydrolipoamide succinyltransferase)
MEIKVPEVGESIYEGLLVKWHKRNGEMVHRDEPLCEIETDKITIELNAEVDGILSINVKEGATVKIGSVIGDIRQASNAQAEPAKASGKAKPAAEASASAGPISPAARKLARQHEVRPEEVQGTGKGGRVTMDDMAARLQSQKPVVDERQPRAAATQEVAAVSAREVRSEPQTPYEVSTEERVTRKPMTPIRKRIAERLLAARQQTAMLTTFNEVDMGRIVALKQKHKEDFKRKHGVALGFMSFFVKACVEALQEFPDVNARIDGDAIVYQHFYDIGIAIGGEKGLVVPVIRDAERLHFAEIEKAIDVFVEKVKTNKLNISDLEGGTFTISNGGVFGSLLSTPILNPPQSAILGMHAIQDRPVALNGKVVIRPMMYLALSYDHRIIDGREAVQFLKKIKEYLEGPEEMLLEA